MRKQKRKAIELVNRLAEVSYLRNKELINENDNKHHFDLYKSRVIEKLIDLQSYYTKKGDSSAQSIINSVLSGKFDEFIHTNMANGYTIDKTAMSIRDNWYGV